MKVLAVVEDREHYLTPLNEFLDSDIVFIKEAKSNIILEHTPNVVLFLADWSYELMTCVLELKKQNILTVLMMDGIIEWKHFFQNPKWIIGGNEAPYFPVYCDKVFVSGRTTKEFLEVLGNEGVAVTGLPRLDSLRRQKKKFSDKLVIGVMSSNTPGYTNEQIKETVSLFNDIYEYSIKHLEVEIKWRLRKGINESLAFNVENDCSKGLDEFVSKVDVVISQPSTVAYEAMALGARVIIADYGISPNYMHAAWEIKSKSQIDLVLKDIVKPNSIKLALQNHYLQENLAYIGSSAKVVVDELKKTCKAINQKKLTNNEDSSMVIKDYRVLPNYSQEEYIKLRNYLIRLEKRLYLNELPRRVFKKIKNLIS